MNNEFVHLRIHSEYDVDKGMARLDSNAEDNIVARAAQQDYPALALADTGNLSGSVKFFESCRKHGIKPIIGCEVCTDDKDNFLLLLCADDDGYNNLCRLISDAYTAGGIMHTKMMTADDTHGIIALSGARRGAVGRALLSGQRETAGQKAQHLAALFPDRFYLEVWRDSRDDDIILAHTLRLGEEQQLPVVASHPVQCADAKDMEALNVRICIAGGQLLGQEMRTRPFTQDPYLLSAEEMHKKFSAHPQLLQNSVEIAKRCNFSFRLNEENFLPSIGKTPQGSADELLAQAQAGLHKKYPANCTAEVKAQYDRRLLDELAVINKENYADYFLIVADFIRWAKQGGIPVGPGRGSAAGSLVAYALDITMIDPIKYGLLFERFLNSERVSMPDIDVDFCVNGRDRVIEYVAEKYGESHVSQIITFGSIGAKAAIRDVGRVLGLPHGYCDGVAKQVPAAVEMTLARALKDSPLLQETRDSERGRSLFDLALKVEGLPRNIGTHAGGVLIAPKPLARFCPRTYVADTETTVSQLDMKDVEKIGLVKFDFLGLRALTILQRAQNDLQESGALPADFAFENLPVEDKKVYELYQRGDTIAVFQCESGGMRALMQQLVPDEFSEIVALMALYRPGPLDAGVTRSYILRKHGKEETHYLTPELKPVLEETRGVFIYQEQVMQMARVLAGFSLGDADILRRAMGKKDKDEMERQRQRFVDGAKDKLPAAKAREVFDQVQSFAGYGFNKSHAAAYAMISYWSAYLKAYFPAVFLAATLSEELDDPKRVRILIKHLRELNIKVLPPDINRSAGVFSAPDSGTVRFGLCALKGVGSAVVADIMNARGERPFTDIFDFCSRLRDSQHIAVPLLEKLVYAGAFDSLHSNRASLLATLSRAVKQAKDGEGVLFAPDKTLIAAQWTPEQQLEYEWKVLGEFTLTDNSLNFHRELLAMCGLHPKFFDDAMMEERVCIAGIFAVARVSPNMRRRKLGSLLLDDDRCEFDVRTTDEVVDALAKKSLQKGLDILIVRGTVKNNVYGSKSVEADGVFTIDDYLRQCAKKLVLQCRSVAADAAAADTKQLREILSPTPLGAPGCEIIIRHSSDGICCDYTLGNKWLIGKDAYYRLKTLKAYQIQSIEFT